MFLIRIERIGIMGGTFNPIHNGHLLAASEAMDQLHLNEVIFIPNAQPPKVENKAVSVSGSQRLAMVKLAVRNNSRFTCSDIELKRRGPSYTVDTVQSLERKYRHADFYLIIGTDEVRLLPKWHHISKLAHLVHFVSVDRDGQHAQSPYRVIDVKMPRFDVSSTMIRNRVLRHRSINYLVPFFVHMYINMHNLYRPSNRKRFHH